MNHLNTILIEGNLTRDPQYRTATDGCSFTIANNRYYLKDGKWVNEACFFIVFAYGKLGESCLKYLTKGRGVRVCGRLKQFTSKRNELPRDYVYILAEHVEFQPNRSERPSPENGANKAAAAGASPNAGGTGEGVTGAVVDANADANKTAQMGTTQMETVQATQMETVQATQARIFDPNAEVINDAKPTATEPDNYAELKGPEAFEDPNANFQPSISINADAEDDAKASENIDKEFVEPDVLISKNEQTEDEPF